MQLLNTLFKVFQNNGVNSELNDSIIRQIYKNGDVWESSIIQKNDSLNAPENNPINNTITGSEFQSQSSLFEGHFYPNENLLGKPLQNDPLGNWFMVLLFSGLVITLFAITFFRRSITMFFGSYFSFSRFSYTKTDINSQPLFIQIPLLINALIVLPLLFVFVQYHSNIFSFSDISFPGIFVFSVIGYLVFVFIKSILIILSGFTFKEKASVNAYLENNISFHLSSGIFLLPIIFISYFSGYFFFIKIGLIILVINYLYKVIKLILIGFSNIRYNLYYKIIYLCTFEFLPVLALIKAGILLSN